MSPIVTSYDNVISKEIISTKEKQLTKSEKSGSGVKQSANSMTLAFALRI